VHAANFEHLDPCGEGGADDPSQGPGSWSWEERLAYVKTLGLVAHGEEPLLGFLAKAIGGVPLPSPWVMRREQDAVFFANPVNGKSSWSHPLEATLKELALFYRVCFGLSPAAGGLLAKAAGSRWQQEATRQCAKWYSVRPEGSPEYFCNLETGESMWEHPAVAVLPAHYLKITFADMLYECMLAHDQQDSRSPRSSEGGKEEHSCFDSDTDSVDDDL
jgi:hypothetical protein